VFIVFFTLATSTLTLTGYTGYIFSAVMTIAGLLWFWRGYQLLRSSSDLQWGRSMFSASLAVILVLSGMLSVGAILP